LFVLVIAGFLARSKCISYVAVVVEALFCVFTFWKHQTQIIRPGYLYPYPPGKANGFIIRNITSSLPKEPPVTSHRHHKQVYYLMLFPNKFSFSEFKA